MFHVLYTKYIEQIKLQQVENYNNKHQEYLIRSGKIDLQKGKVLADKKPNNRINSNTQQVNKSTQRQNNIQSRTSKQTQTINYNNFANANNNTQTQIQNTRIPNISIKPQSNYEERPITSNKNKYTFYDQYPQTETNKLPQPQPKHYNQSQNHQIRNSHAASSQPHFNNNNHKNLKQQKPAFEQFPDQQQENILLQECPQGCGRKFKSDVLQKHIKICQKVFQNKRKPFKVDIVDDQAKKLAQKNSQQLKKSNQEQQKPKSDKVPKWKKQSQMLRRGLKVQNEGGSNQNIETNIEVEQVDDRIQCGGCGRKFNEKAAEKHIAGCIKRSKKNK